MGRRRLIAFVAGCAPLCTGSIACTGADGESSPAITDGASVVSSSPVTALDLAPSQLTASTVARPDSPPPCDPAVISVWTAQVSLTEPSSTATLRVRNDGTTRCEIDIGASPAAAADVEPNVWVDRGQSADLVVWSSVSTCAAEVTTSVTIAINGSIVDVPTGAVGMCSPALVAFYVQEPGEEPCSELDVAVTDELLLVRNAADMTCNLGPLVAVDGVQVDEVGAPTIAITELARGDVVAFDLSSRAGPDCGVQPTVVSFEAAGAVEVGGLDRCLAVMSGVGRPWFGGRGDPLADVDDVDAARVALDPFASR